MHNTIYLHRYCVYRRSVLENSQSKVNKREPRVCEERGRKKESGRRKKGEWGLQPMRMAWPPDNDSAWTLGAYYSVNLMIDLYRSSATLLLQRNFYKSSSPSNIATFALCCNYFVANVCARKNVHHGVATKKGFSILILALFLHANTVKNDFCVCFESIL